MKTNTQLKGGEAGEASEMGAIVIWVVFLASPSSEKNHNKKLDRASVAGSKTAWPAQKGSL